MAEIQPADLTYLAQFLLARSGLVVNADKAYLLESRLGPLARKQGFASIALLIGKLRSGDRLLEQMVVEAMTTNESFFFRDQKPFDHFRDHVLPHMIQARAAKRSLRIWCAAASTGQEPYSIAMILKEAEVKMPGWRFEIIGTDISREVLDRARQGHYSQFEVQRGLPITHLVKYFKKAGEVWQIDASLRSMVQYKEWNLLQDPRPLGQFDVVFCRNVLIYFDNPTKGKVLEGISRQMPGDGFLYLGGSETVIGLTTGFAPMTEQRGVYRPQR
ncbi:MAG TPA: protein-glutamate O-methyltransferase CheR [Candidatus Sulfotelmatobacter sp.]|jgi:chemotaxis protein methyltransferase CheR|nr:protein-glutamate O-methyltransferase CheR [Candidatus Sulfotelmatobacter sp.]